MQFIAVPTGTPGAHRVGASSHSQRGAFHGGSRCAQLLNSLDGTLATQPRAL